MKSCGKLFRFFVRKYSYNKVFLMNTERELQGEWYLPGNEKDSFAGTFTYTRSKGCYLEIWGAFEDFFLPKSKRQSIILGKTITGEKLTLVECIRMNCKGSSNGVTVAKYLASFVFIGDHFEGLQGIEFDSLSVSLCDIETWVGIYGFDKLDLNLSENIIDIQYGLPNEESFFINDLLTLSFEFSYTFPLIKGYHEARIHQSTLLKIDSQKPQPFKSMLRNLFILYKFISLSYFDSPYILRVEVKNSRNEIKPGLSKRIELLYSDNYFNENYKGEKERDEFLFTYQSVSDNFPVIIRSWFTLIDRIEPAVNLFNELLLKRKYPLEIKFLSSVQALETFHRNIFGGEEINTTDHKRRLELIYKSAPEEHKKWLKEKLAFSNEPSLKNRLRDLYRKIPREITYELIKDEEEFIKGVVDTRNYYTHYSDKLKEKAMSRKEISKAVEKLKILLACLILNEIGFSKDQVVKSVEISKLYPYAD
jgi:hypothetical protein